MKKSVSRVFACFVILGVLMAGGAAFAQDVLTLTIGHVVTEEGGEHLGSLKFAELLDEKSGGKIKLKIFPNGQVGQNREMVESLQAGALDMALPALPGLGGFTDATQVFDLFYLFDDRAEAEKVLDGPVGQDVAAAMEASGVKIISWWSQGFRETTANREIKKPEDLKGLKIRVMENPLHIEAWNMLGASAIPMAFSEVLTSLQQGVLDAQENPYQNIVHSGFYTVQKYIIETSHLYGPLPVAYSKVNWDKLTPEQQKIIMEAVEETKVWQREKQEEINKELKAKIEATGSNVIISLSAEEKAAFRKSLAPLYKKHAPKMYGYVERIFEQLGRSADF